MGWGKYSLSFIPCTRLDLQCKIHDLGAMNLAPSPTRGLWGHSIENIATHSPEAMKLGPIEYKDWLRLEIAKFPTSANFVTSHEVSNYCLVDWLMQFSFCQTEKPGRN